MKRWVHKGTIDRKTEFFGTIQHTLCGKGGGFDTFRTFNDSKVTCPRCLDKLKR